MSSVALRLRDEYFLPHRRRRRQVDQGNWKESKRWNDITVFNESSQSYIQQNFAPGDLICVIGFIEQTTWEKDGETQFGVTLACDKFGRLAKGPNHAATEGEESPE